VKSLQGIFGKVIKEQKGEGADKERKGSNGKRSFII
jgi:hypothetical protein